MNKLLSCRYNMDTNRVEALFSDASAITIDCIVIEDKYGNAPAQRAELDWLLYMDFFRVRPGGAPCFIFSELCTHTGAAQQPFPCSCPAAFPYRPSPPAG